MKFANTLDLNDWMNMFGAKKIHCWRSQIRIRMVIENVEIEYTFKTLQKVNGSLFSIDNDNFDVVAYDDNTNMPPFVARGKGSRSTKIRQIAKDRLNVLFL